MYHNNHESSDKGGIMDITVRDNGRISYLHLLCDTLNFSVVKSPGSVCHWVA